MLQFLKRGSRGFLRVLHPATLAPCPNGPKSTVRCDPSWCNSAQLHRYKRLRFCAKREDQRGGGKGLSTLTAPREARLVVFSRLSSTACRQGGDLGSGSAAVFLTDALVFVKAAPYWLDEPQNLILAPGEDGRLVCRANGNPKPAIQWLVNGEPIEGEQGRIWNSFIRNQPEDLTADGEHQSCCRVPGTH